MNNNIISENTINSQNNIFLESYNFYIFITVRKLDNVVI